jgi:hypothetical protein
VLYIRMPLRLHPRWRRHPVVLSSLQLQFSPCSCAGFEFSVRSLQRCGPRIMAAMASRRNSLQFRVGRYFLTICLTLTLRLQRRSVLDPLEATTVSNMHRWMTPQARLITAQPPYCQTRIFIQTTAQDRTRVCNAHHSIDDFH